MTNVLSEASGRQQGYEESAVTPEGGAPTRRTPVSEIVLYTTEDGETNIDVLVGDESVWLTQEQLVELFQRDQSVISRHTEANRGTVLVSAVVRR